MGTIRGHVCLFSVGSALCLCLRAQEGVSCENDQEEVDLAVVRCSLVVKICILTVTWTYVSVSCSLSLVCRNFQMDFPAYALSTLLRESPSGRVHTNYSLIKGHKVDRRWLYQCCCDRFVVTVYVEVHVLHLSIKMVSKQLSPVLY